MATFDTKGQKTAFVTGASSGIGKAAAVALSRAGYRVIGTSRKAEPGEVRDGIRLPRALFDRILRKQFNIA